MNNVLRRYIVEIIKDIDEDSDEITDVDVNEFSSIGGGAIAGFIAPLGLSGKDIEGPKVKERKKKKKQATWK